MFGRVKKLESRIVDLESSIAAREAMFEKRLSAAEARLEARLAEVLARVGGDPNERMRFLLDAAVEDLRGGLAQALELVRRADALAEGSEARTRGEGEHQPRQWMELCKVHRAPFTGYVAAFQTGEGPGHDTVELVVGPEDPPLHVVCRFDAGSDSGGFAGCVVRRGEYWRASSQREETHRNSQVGERLDGIGGGILRRYHAANPPSGVKCVYTPFL